MSVPFNIVVVVNRSTDANYVLRKAAAIASSNPDGAAVHVIRVIFEEFIEQQHVDAEQAQSLKLFLMQAEEEFLADLVEEHKNSFTDIETATLWNKRSSDAILSAADTFGADLIIKSADPESPHFPRHPDDWNLLRGAACPVFLVKPEPWPAHAGVVAAINASDFEHKEMNTRILNAANTIATAMSGKLHVANALPASNPMLRSAELGVDFTALEQDIEQELRRELSGMLEAAGATGAALHVAPGNAGRMVKCVAESTHAAVVVAGTAGRKGVSAMIIGNTSETLLQTLDQDLLVLHV